MDDSNPLIIDYPEFKFHPNDYLLNNTTYFIDHNIFLGVSYIFAAGYNYLVEKHFKTKKNIYISDSEKKPQFFEIIHQPSKRFIKMRDSNFTGDDAYFNKIVEYIESLSVCFTSFDLGYLLYYEEVEVFDGTNKTTTKNYRIDNSLIKTDTSEGHCVSVLVYRNGTDVQVTIIDNNEITSTQEKKLFDFFFTNFTNRFTNSLNFRQLKTYNVTLNVSEYALNYDYGGYCSLITILLNEILWQNIFVHDVFGFRIVNTTPPAIDNVGKYINLFERTN